MLVPGNMPFSATIGGSLLLEQLLQWTKQRSIVSNNQRIECNFRMLWGYLQIMWVILILG